MFPPRTQLHFSSGGVFSVGAPSRQQDSSGVRCCCDFCSSVVSQAFKKWYLYLAYFYLRELAEHTSLPPSSGGLEVKALGIVHFAHVPLAIEVIIKA